MQTKHVKKFGKPKTDNSRRVIPIHDHLLALLKTHKVQQNIIRLKTGSEWDDNDLIFPTRYGKPQRLSNIGEKMKRILALTDIKKHLTPKSFRKTFATIGRNNVINRKTVSTVLGHGKEAITDDFYVIVEQDDCREATETICRILLKTG